MKPTTSCKNPTELLHQMIADGWANAEVEDYFAALGFDFFEVRTAIREARKK